MKRILLLLFSSGLLSSLALAQASLNVPNVTGAAGAKVLVPITITGGEGVSAVQFTVSFDPSTLSLSDEAPLLGKAIADHTLGFSRKDNSFTFVVFSGSLKTFSPGKGTLASVVFEVSDGSSDGTIVPLTVSDAEGADSDGGYLSVIGVDGSVSVGSGGNVPAEGENELIFPQIANGSFTGGSFGVFLVFVNRTDVTSSAQISFFKSDGSPFVLSLTDGSTDSVFGFEVAPGGSAFLATDGTGDLATGYARLNSTAPLGGTLLFASRDSGGTVLTEAGVGDSPLASHFSVPVVFEPGLSNIGIAFANALQEDSNLVLSLKDSDGVEVDKSEFSLLAGEHLARFATELFNGFNTSEDFQGSIEVESTSAVSAVALKLQGPLLTTFPVVNLP